MKKIQHFSVKKTLLLICLAAVLLSFHSAMGAESSNLTDISGTPFFEPVSDLNRAGIVEGYPDDTFRPYRNLSRAEAVTMIYRAYGNSTLALTNPFYFKDVPPDMWAAPYIDYGAGAGIINGYPDKTFRPDTDITYNEVIALIIRARGLDPGNLSWPDGYHAIARQDGMLNDLYGAELPSDGNLPANRGNTASLIASGSEYNETAAEGPSEDVLTDPDMACICYGLLRETVSGNDKLGNHCGWGRLLMGSITYDILTTNKAPGLFSGFNPAFGLLRIHIGNGRADTKEKITWAWQENRSCGLLTPASPEPSMTEFCRITSINGSTLSWQANSGQNGTLSLRDETVCYEISLEGGIVAASSITSSEIKENDMAAVYSLSNAHEVDIVIVVHPKDTSDILHASDHPNVMYMG